MMDITSNLRLRIRTQNQTIDAVVDSIRKEDSDDIGALYYVVAVVLIYGLSIVMMIASHIRKNKQDNQLRTYLKEMAILRKKDRREKLVGKMTNVPTTTSKPTPSDIVIQNTVLGNKAELTKLLHTPTVVPEIDEDSFQKTNTSDETTDSVFQFTYDDVSENSSPKAPGDNNSKFSLNCVKQNSKSNFYVSPVSEQTKL